MESLSLIIPTKNEAEGLPHLLEALKRQTLQPEEVIVADAQSTDNTRDIARSFGAVVVEGGLPSVGRNRGAAVARGSVLLFLDADVTLLENTFLEKTLREFAERKLDIASIGVCLPDGALYDKISHELYNLYAKAWGKRHPHAPGCCIFSRKKLHESIHGFDEQALFCEDHDYAGRAVRSGAQFGFLEGRIGLNTRRQDLEGRMKLVIKYVLAEMHLLFLGPVHHDKFRYHFDYSEQRKKR